MDVLCLLVFLRPRSSQSSAYSGHLEPTPLSLWHVGVVVIDPDGAVAQLGRNAVCCALVGRPHSAGQSIIGVIAQSNGFSFSFEGFHCEIGRASCRSRVELWVGEVVSKR